MGSGKSKSRGSRRKKAATRRGTVDRFQVMNELRASATDRWAQSTNPVKKRIGRLEIAWREGLQWLAEDLQKMFQNFRVVGDAYDRLDVNVAAIKAILIEKDIITHEEFEEKQTFLIGILNAERQRRQEELQRLQRESDAAALERAELERKAAEAAEGAADGSTVTPELKRIHQAATEAGSKDEIEVPAGARVFGG